SGSRYIGEPEIGTVFAIVDGAAVLTAVAGLLTARGGTHPISDPGSAALVGGVSVFVISRTLQTVEAVDGVIDNNRGERFRERMSGGAVSVPGTITFGFTGTF